MAKQWPHDTHEKLLAAGYTFVDAAPCKSAECGKTVQWYRTPNDRMMPFSTLIVVPRSSADGVGPGEEYRLQPHFADCKEASKFTSRGSKAGAA